MMDSFSDSNTAPQRFRFQKPQRFLFQKHQRLISKSDFQHVFDNAKLKVGLGEVLILAVSNNNGYSRLGVVVPKKNVRQAHDRNRIKRCFRESFRLHQHQLTLLTMVPNSDQTSEHSQAVNGMDIVIMGRRDVLNLTSSQLQEKLNSGWLKVMRVANKYLAVS